MLHLKCKPYNYKDKMVILGDAAHAMVPFYGQGMNCGFEDVLVLDEIWTKIVGQGRINPNSQQLEQILNEYSEIRNPDAEAMCELALHNYIEMRSSVTNPKYLLRKKIEGFLHCLFPKSVIPLYTMVSFSRIRYSKAMEKFRVQSFWFEVVLNIFTIAAVGGIGSLLWIKYRSLR